MAELKKENFSYCNNKYWIVCFTGGNVKKLFVIPDQNGRKRQQQSR